MSKKPLLTLLSTAALTALTALSVPMTLHAAPGAEAQAAPTKAQYRKNGYIVMLSEMPVVAYDGGIKGYAATKPKKGQKIDPTSPQVVNYMSYLTSRHDAVLNGVGGGRKLYDYGYAFNGFAADLTPAQVQTLRSTPGVVAVEKDAIRYATTSSTPSFIGLDAPGGLWEQLGGTASAGDGVIIGIVDSGIWPESLSFTDRTGANGNATKDGKLAFQQIAGWHGKCTPGEAFNASLCNQKLIGAQWFNAGQGGNAGIDADNPWEYNSVRDYNGHGTHTASTSGGNHGVATTGPASIFGAISGMAPHARIAAYKALWSTQSADTASGTTSDLVDAIDTAVADGVDVINYSISGTLTNFRDPAEIAFLFAADAGVFVAASAGNSGPTTSTVAHPSPWITTVAAGTHNRGGNGSVTLGNGATYYGASVAAAVGPAPFIDSKDAGLPGANATAVALCFAAVDNDGTAVLDPAKVAGKIVLCDRGSNARVNKSLAVKEAGGVGMVLVNTSANSINADFHFVPSVHLAHTDRPALKAYAATAGATATINQATIVYDVPAPLTASFSSRGPLLAGGGDLLKPDIIAPGQDILAAVAPPGNHGLDFNLYSGTSMSSPHVAGLGALLKQLHPNWSPMAIKSALMTTATDVLDGVPGFEAHPTVLFREGAGHVNPTGAANPGLVYDSNIIDWLGFLCGTQLGATYCTDRGIPVLDPSNLNTPSIAVGDLAGAQTVTRRVTNVGSARATYRASVQDMAGFTVAIVPSEITLNPGQTAKFDVTLTRNGAPLNQYAFGSGGFLIWTNAVNADQKVRIPMVARPVALAAPVQVNATRDTSYDVTFGYSGSFTATARGLIPPAITAGVVPDDPTDSSCSLTSPNAQLITVAIPAGTTYARFALFDADVVNPGSTDIDLCVFRGTTLVGTSGSGTSAEEVNLLNPAADNYTVVVAGFAVPGTSPFKLHTWLLGSADAGNMTVVAPASATLGQQGTIELHFNGLTAGTKYLGSVVYGGVSGMPNPTIVRVDP